MKLQLQKLKTPTKNILAPQIATDDHNPLFFFNIGKKNERRKRGIIVTLTGSQNILCKTWENSNFLRKGKMVISVKI